MIEINLIPDVKQELIKAQRTRFSVITVAMFVGIGSVVVVVLLAMNVFGVQALRDSSADKSIAQGIKELKAVKDLPETLTIQNQLTKISKINSEKNINSRVFDLLGAIIPPEPNNIQISSVSVDSGTRIIVIDGQAPNSYSAVEVFKKTIKGSMLRYTIGEGKPKDIKLASNISLGETSYGADKTGAKVLRFKLSFDYAPELFDPASKDTSIVIAIDGNVTDSYLGIPKSIFTDRATDIKEEK